MKNGTSAPSCSPSSCSRARGSSRFHSRLSARSTVAASDEPPPMPPATGSTFSSVISSPSFEPHERSALALVLLVLDLPAALLERTELAIGRLLQAGGRIGRGLAAHPVGESLERQPKAERALGERLAVGRAKFLAFGGRELHRVALAHDAREALAERRADQHLVARARVAPEDIAGESFRAVARCDAAEKLEIQRGRWLQFDVSARRGE